MCDENATIKNNNRVVSTRSNEKEDEINRLQLKVSEVENKLKSAKNENAKLKKDIKECNLKNEELNKRIEILPYNGSQEVSSNNADHTVTFQAQSNPCSTDFTNIDVRLK